MQDHFAAAGCFAGRLPRILNVVTSDRRTNMEDSVQIHCTRCKNVFRDRARRLQNGYSRQCPSCEVMLFFDEDSANPVIKRVMRTARRIRKELRENENAPATTRSGASRRFSGRAGAGARDETSGDDD